MIKKLVLKIVFSIIGLILIALGWAYLLSQIPYTEEIIFQIILIVLVMLSSIALGAGYAFLIQSWIDDDIDNILKL